ncbi:cyclin-dependent protein kinase [Encephalitozoon cuniculi EcunIII-L]|uniref:Cell cycle protein kinase n=1 Tax=Encephalitozoon cuniculi TaxID=6035 RepID=M1K2R1_ENCCN|nr:cell cycle protein kinase [Encephalitozoon cuniculi]KMV65704.1 cyclin-dependent protein kinase [Encephalitozoon cuniculi EcunIII-L]UYI27110.1 cell-division protein kinase [Encephalitozoon cuniculi]
MEKYENIKQVGEGAFGQVYKSRRTSDGAVFAIKKMPVDRETGFPFTAIREIKLCKSVINKHIIGLDEIVFEEGFIFVVLEYMPYDLTGLLASGAKLSTDQIRSITSQLIEAVSSMHGMGLVHRDIKPSNILLDCHGMLKLTDFGLTREISGMMTNRVCTLWYRAPELLLGETSYSLKVDAWSVGCIMLEMRLGRPPYRGSDEVSQIKLIFEELGIPQDKYKWSDLLDVDIYSKSRSTEEIIAERYGHLFDEEELKVLSGFLCLTSRKRLSVANSRYFTVISSHKNTYIPLSFEEAHELYTKERKEMKKP